MRSCWSKSPEIWLAKSTWDYIFRNDKNKFQRLKLFKFYEKERLLKFRENVNNKFQGLQYMWFELPSFMVCSKQKKKKKKKTQQRLKNWTSSCSGHSIFCGWSSLEIPSYPLPRPHPWETSTDEMWNMLLIILDDPFAIYMISNDSEITNRKH